jgi:proline dehydrogenase
MAVIDKLFAPNSPLQARFFFLAKRFVAGETIESAIETVGSLNSVGLSATLDFLGEDVLLPEEALKTRDAYLATLAAIQESGVRTNVSLKLTALGLLVDEDLCLRYLTDILERAAQLADPFVRIDMEGSSVTDATLRVFERAFERYKNVGIVIQAYLRRSPQDVERAIGLGARVRLCKGAYSEPQDIAYPDMPSIRREYLRLAEALLSRGHYPGIATHDERIIAAVKSFVTQRGISLDSFEFQLLYGVRPDLQRELVREGYNVRIYVPFGSHWAGYFYRRITERRENAWFAIRSIFAR